MAIKAYSLAKDGNKKLSANFAVKEFRCKDGTDPIFIDDVLVKLLQNIRNHFGKAVTITSAYRTAAHNKAVKGATYSQHCYGMAADIRIQGVDVETLATYAETLLKNTGGIGRYPVKTGRPAGWVHNRHPCGKEPLGGLRVGGKQNGEHSESFSDGIP